MQNVVEQSNGGGLGACFDEAANDPRGISDQALLAEIALDERAAEARYTRSVFDSTCSLFQMCSLASRSTLEYSLVFL